MASMVRLLDLGLVDPVRSQTVYHAVAHAFDDQTPDTIILVGPNAPYVCIGYHQELEKEVDTAYCREAGLPVLRREVGGGAVYLDEHQLFAQWVFRRSNLPAGLAARFEYYIRPLVATYHELGIEAYLRPINDVQVGGRKIGGTGAMAVGEAEVLVGSLMFDFNSELMSRVLKVSSEKMRDKIFQSLQEYMTTMRRELGTPPAREHAQAIYLSQCERMLGLTIVPGTLTPRELAMAEALDARFVSDEWLYQKGGLRQSGVKIHEDVRVVEAAHKAPGGLVRVTARLREGRIDDISFSGDFTILPTLAVGALEQALRGIVAEPTALAAALREAYRALAIQAPGLTPEDLAAAVLAAAA